MTYLAGQTSAKGADGELVLAAGDPERRLVLAPKA